MYVYLTLVQNIPVLSVGKDNYGKEKECQSRMRVEMKTHFGASRATGWMKAKDELCERS